MENEDKLLTTAEVAELLQTSEHNVYRKVKAGMPVLKFGQLFRFQWPKVLEWIERNSGDQSTADMG
jgi:excisionase family DNA binding protein